VVVVATAAPAFALSGPPPTIDFNLACKYPGNSCATRPKGYSLFGQISNPSSRTVYIYSVTIQNVSGTQLTFTQSAPPLPITVVAGGNVPFEFAATSGNSAQQGFSGTYVVAWGHSLPPGSDPDNHPPINLPVIIASTPPDCPTCPPA
jgi:hypothetical protein